MSLFTIVSPTLRTLVTIYAQNEAQPPKAINPVIVGEAWDNVFSADLVSQDRERENQKACRRAGRKSFCLFIIKSDLHFLWINP